MKRYAKFTLTLIALWFTFALTASVLHLFENPSNRIGGAVAIAAVVPILIFGVWYAVSERFRQFVLSIDPRLLTVVQMGRTMGFTFLLLQARDLLPAVFAFPAGYGDMTVGITATLVAWKLAEPSGADPARRLGFIAWQILGITDLVVAVGVGTTAPLLNPDGVSMRLMTVLPLSLIPTFLVPLYLILHVISIAQARRWPLRRYATTGTVQPAGA